MSNKKILLVEDDVNLLFGLEAKLRVEGFDTATDQGTDQAEIINKISTLKPDYIVLDIILPRVDGFEILAQLKAKPETAKIPIFVFTNLSDSDSRQRAEKLGADFYLLKTELNLDEFVDKFKKILANNEKLSHV